MKKKFDDMYETLRNGNISDFKKWIKSLSKANLLLFCIHCEHYDLLDLHKIHHYLTTN